MIPPGETDWFQLLRRMLVKREKNGAGTMLINKIILQISAEILQIFIAIISTIWVGA